MFVSYLNSPDAVETQPEGARADPLEEAVIRVAPIRYVVTTEAPMKLALQQLHVSGAVVEPGACEEGEAYASLPAIH